MEYVNADWIKARLTGKHGEQARLAEAMGISRDKLSKILQGVRQVKAVEVPGAIRYFEAEASKVDPEPSDQLSWVVETFQSLSDEDKADAVAYLAFRKERAKAP